MSASQVDTKSATEVVTYNPEFFPTLPELELSDEQLEEMERVQEEADVMNSEVNEKGQIAVPLTRNFDSLGDFIESRWVVKGPQFEVVARVGVNPHAYSKVKARTYALSQELPAITSNVSVH